MDRISADFSTCESHPGPIAEWLHWLEAAWKSPAAFRELIEYLAADNHDAEPLKSCSPFVGLE